MKRPTVAWAQRVRAAEVAAQRHLRTNASALEWFAVVVHHVGREAGLLLAAGVALYAGHWSWALKALLLMSLGEVLNGLLKFVTREPRPVWREDVAMSPFPHAKKKPWETDYSFPSSHAQVLLGLAVSFQHLAPRHPVLVALAYALAVAAGLSRAYLGQHYFHDVLAGWLVELAVALPFWRLVDAWVALAPPAAAATTAALFFSPLLLELAVKVMPKEVPAELSKWEKHAQHKTGCRDKKLHTLETGKYFLQGASCAAAYASLAVAVHTGTLGEYDCTCAASSLVQRMLVVAMRLALGVPCLALMLLFKGHSGWKCVLNVRCVLCAMVGVLVVPRFVAHMPGLRCIC